MKRQLTIYQFNERLSAIVRGLDPDKVKDASIIIYRPSNPRESLQMVKSPGVTLGLSRRSLRQE